jgi:hypothetical protein
MLERREDRPGLLHFMYIFNSRLQTERYEDINIHSYMRTTPPPTQQQDTG